MDRFDCLILGGGLTGGAAATLLARRHPSARIGLIEARPGFAVRGEVATDLAALFLVRELRLWDHLAAAELPYQGERFWFQDDDVVSIQSASEFGPRLQPPTPAFLLREDRVGQELLRRAAELGVLVIRPGRVEHVDIRPFDSAVFWHDGGPAQRRAQATWVLDATGDAAFLARQLGLVRPMHEHPLVEIACRWRGDLDLDGARFDPETEFARWPRVARRLSSNHFVGYGYQVRFLALGRDEIEASLFIDRRVIPFGADTDIADLYTRFLSGLPAVRQMLHHAHIVSQDLRVVDPAAWSVERPMGEGWALLGGAAGRMDTIGGFSADLAAQTIESTLAVVADGLAGRPIDKRIARYNRDFLLGWERTFRAMHHNRLLVHGDFALFWPLWSMQRALWHLAVVGPAARRTSRLARPFFTGAWPALAAIWLRIAQSRFLRLARTRMWTGNYGANNAMMRREWRSPYGAGVWLLLLAGLVGWLLREFEHWGLSVVRRVAHDGGRRTMPEGADLATLPLGVEILAQADNEPSLGGPR